MASSDKTAKSTAAAKTSRPVTLKHLAAALADEHQLTKRAGEAILAISSSLSQSISKRMTESELWVWASCRLESEPLAWAAIRQPVKQLRSRQARKSHFGQPRI